MNVAEVWRMSPGEHADLLAGGHPIDPRALEDQEFRGVSLGLPGVVEKLTWKKFRKAFHRDPGTGRLRGWNVRLVQDGLERQDTPREDRGAPKAFGHFEVRDLGGYRWPGGRRAPSEGLMLDYGRGGNGWDPIRFLRDPLVALDAGDPSVLFGWSYLALAGRPVPVCVILLPQVSIPYLENTCRLVH